MLARVWHYLQGLEWRWSLVLQVVGLMASFALPAWAVDAARILADYSPASWVVAGFGGMLTAALVYFLIGYGRRAWIRATFDGRFLDRHGGINPLDRVFQNQRIYLNDFVLPSSPVVENKMFYNCEIVGPANVWFAERNHTDETRLPPVDAVYLDPTQKPPNNCFVLIGCTFRQCSFQRVTIYLGHVDYQNHTENNWMNWVSLTPKSIRNPTLFAPEATAESQSKPTPLAARSDTQSPPDTQ